MKKIDELLKLVEDFDPQFDLGPLADEFVAIGWSEFDEGELKNFLRKKHISLDPYVFSLLVERIQDIMR